MIIVHLNKDIYTVCQNPGCSKKLIGKNKKKFCSRSCSVTVSNFDRQRNFASHGRLAKKPCVYCGKITTNPKFCDSTCDGESRRIYQSERERKQAKLFRHKLYMMRKKRQTPSWANIEKIKEIYMNCPEGYEVDHIWPISKYGLHVHYNLQYLTIIENRNKLDSMATVAQLVEQFICNEQVVGAEPTSSSREKVR